MLRLRMSLTVVFIGALAIAALLQGAAVLSSAGRAAAATTPGIGFGVPSVVDPVHTYGEPDVGIDGLGRVFVSGPTGTGTQRSVWSGSVDAGHSFRSISPGPPPSSITGLIDPPGGGDTDINFDRSNKQYFADLYALTCLRTATTSDGGATVQQAIYPAGCGANGGKADRQWLAVFDPAPGTPKQSAYSGPKPLIYMEYNDVINGAQWAKSLDGLNYVNAQSTGPNTIAAPFGADGYPAIDQVTGKLFQAAGKGNSDGTYSFLLNIGTPNAAGDLTFLDGNVGNTSKLIHIADNLKGSPDTLFTVLSLDSARNLFAVAAIGSDNPADRQVIVGAASAASGWKNWKTVQVSQPPSLVNVFPWIKAGGPGRADAVWYGSDKSVDPSSQSGQAWNAFMSQVIFPVNASGGVTGAAPSATMVKVSPHPMHYNDICLQGSSCITSQGNRNLADFFAVTIDSSGAAEVVYDDTSNGLVQSGFTPGNQQLVDHAGAGVVTLARQNSGPGLFGTSVSGPSSGQTSGISDPSGDALYPIIGGTNVPGLDIVRSSVGQSEGRLTVTVKVADLTAVALAAAQARVPGTTNLQYVTRWQVGNTIYYAAMEKVGAGAPSFYAGKAKSLDLCSVSACFPHVITYPEPGTGPTFTGSPETGSVSCPSHPSASNPCTLTIRVKAADVGLGSGSNRFEEVGSYGLTAALQEGAETNPTAESDTVPLEVDGVCCYNSNV